MNLRAKLIVTAWMSFVAACGSGATHKSGPGAAGGGAGSGAAGIVGAAGAQAGTAGDTSGPAGAAGAAGVAGNAEGSAGAGQGGGGSGASVGAAGAGGSGAGGGQPPNPVAAQSPWTINSPDGKVIVRIAQAADGGALSYAVDYAGKTVIGPSAIGLKTTPVDLSNGLQFMAGTTALVQENYAIPTGKRSAYVNHANELTLRFTKSAREVDLVVRAYDEGGAYRFFIPTGGALTIGSETGGFALPAGTTGWAAPMAADYQGLWDARTEAELAAGSYELPVLVKVPDGTWAFLSEASVYSTYFGSHVRGRAGALSLEGGGSNVSVSAPFGTPWRLVMVGASLSSIVESTMVESLNPPSEVTDTSWIKPGRSSWSWWSGDSTSSYPTQTTYVDFAASMGWQYHLCDEGWQASWMPNLVQYAAGKGVGIWLWIAGENMNTDAKIDANIKQWAAWGIKGVKVDYVYGDSSTELAVYDKIAVAAAKAHIMVNYHGCTKPSGERRRWPHLMTREAIYGAEQYKPGPGPTAKLNCIVPFTRNVQGPMDYTPVTYSNTRGQTTSAHQTALDVVFESGVQHLADKPATYNASVAKEFLKAVPASWDDTKLVEGDPGSYVTLARRSGTAWFVGAITVGARSAAVPLAFLGPGSYTAEIIRDGASDAEQVREQQTVTRATVLTIPLRLHGGCAIHLTPG